MPVAYEPTGGKLERHDRAVERVGHLDQDAGAVAGVGLGAGGAPVIQAADRGERLREDRVALAALHVDDEADAAAVVLEARVVETVGAREVRIGYRDVRRVAIGHVGVVLWSGGQFRVEQGVGAGHRGTTLARRRSRDCSGPDARVAGGSATPDVRRRRSVGGVGEHLRRGEVEVLAEVAQPVAGHHRGTDRARGGRALQPEHRRELAEVVAGLDEREPLLGAVVARPDDLDLALVDHVHEIAAVALLEQRLARFEAHHDRLARRGVGARA